MEKKLQDLERQKKDEIKINLEKELENYTHRTNIQDADGGKNSIKDSEILTVETHFSKLNQKECLDTQPLLNSLTNGLSSLEQQPDTLNSSISSAPIYLHQKSDCDSINITHPSIMSQVNIPVTPGMHPLYRLPSSTTLPPGLVHTPAECSGSLIPTLPIRLPLSNSIGSKIMHPMPNLKGNPISKIQSHASTSLNALSQSISGNILSLTTFN